MSSKRDAPPWSSASARTQNTASLGAAEGRGFRLIAEITSMRDHHPDGSRVLYVTYALDLPTGQSPGKRSSVVTTERLTEP